MDGDTASESTVASATPPPPLRCALTGALFEATPRGARAYLAHLLEGRVARADPTQTFVYMADGTKRAGPTWAGNRIWDPGD